MRLDIELVKRKLCDSRTEAQELISKGAVVVNGSIATKQTKDVGEGDNITVMFTRQFVSRGGEKLLGVMRTVFGSDDEIRVLCESKIALDVGSSTGGFTDCLLSYGATHVDAVDVGTSQLHAKLQGDERVTLYENTDIRSFTTHILYDIIVADLSFIPLFSIFDDIVKHGTSGTHYFLLIKPQFEVGKGNTKKGIVKDASLVSEVLMRYQELAEQKGMQSVTIIPSSIQGKDGNQEYFLVANT